MGIYPFILAIDYVYIVIYVYIISYRMLESTIITGLSYCGFYFTRMIPISFDDSDDQSIGNKLSSRSNISTISISTLSTIIIYS